MKNYYTLNLIFLFVLSYSLSFAQEIVSIGNAEGSAGQPISRFFRYHASEMIYLQDEIDADGEITKLAFNKVSGSNTAPIENVSIYMKSSTTDVLASGTESLNGYVLVYEGDFTNDATSGWMEVDLDTPFAYANEEHLHVFVVKGFQADLASAQFARFANTSSDPALRHRNYNDDSQAWSETRSMTASAARPDVRLTFESVEICENPLDISVTLENGVLTATQEGVTYQWWDCNANTPVDGAYQRSFEPSAHGNYKVVLDAGDVCEAESACVEVTSLVGVDVFDFEVSVFPNPVGDVLTVSVAQVSGTLDLVDVLGKVYQTIAISNIETQIDMSSLPNGMYVVRFQNGTTNTVKRIIKH
jgi:hypothetical protein